MLFAMMPPRLRRHVSLDLRNAAIDAFRLMPPPADDIHRLSIFFFARRYARDRLL